MFRHWRTPDHPQKRKEGKKSEHDKRQKCITVFQKAVTSLAHAQVKTVTGSHAQSQRSEGNLSEKERRDKNNKQAIPWLDCDAIKCFKLKVKRVRFKVLRVMGRQAMATQGTSGTSGDPHKRGVKTKYTPPEPRGKCLPGKLTGGGTITIL